MPALPSGDRLAGRNCTVVARALGITVPLSLLSSRADEVIE
jgi:hypothetical protein